MMLISLDYDNTYTEDPSFWKEFIVSAKNRGHIVMVITARNEFTHGGEIEKEIPGIEVIYTNGEPKKEFCNMNDIPEPAIWIDDMPHLI